MSGSVLLARKDLIVLFRSPLAYLVLACFLFLAGLFFSAHLQNFEQLRIQLMRAPEITDVTPTEWIIQPYLYSLGLIFLFILPFLTMRGFSEEKKMGAFEVLLSYPLTELHLVGGKLLALAFFLVAALAASALSPAMLALVSEIEILPLLVGYFGLFLLGVSFISIGLFFSSLTENQIISVVSTFVVLLMLWLLNSIKDIAPPEYGPVLTGFSPLGHFEPFTKGVAALSDIVFYLTFTAGFCWLTVLSLENQRWRG